MKTRELSMKRASYNILNLRKGLKINRSYCISTKSQRKVQHDGGSVKVWAYMAASGTRSLIFRCNSMMVAAECIQKPLKHSLCIHTEMHQKKKNAKKKGLVMSGVFQFDAVIANKEYTTKYQIICPNHNSPNSFIVFLCNFTYKTQIIKFKKTFSKKNTVSIYRYTQSSEHTNTQIKSHSALKWLDVFSSPLPHSVHLCPQCGAVHTQYSLIASYNTNIKA